MMIFRPPRAARWARGLVLLVTVGLVALAPGPAAPEAAAVESSSADGTIDLFVQEGSIVQPGQVITVRVTLRAAPAQPIPERAVRLSVTVEPLATETSLRRFLGREVDPLVNVVDVRLSPSVLELETGDVRIPIIVPGDPTAIGAAPATYGIQAELIESVNAPDSDALLQQRQVLTVVPADANVPSTPVAPIVTLSVPPAGGGPLSAAELEAYTVEGGALNQVRRVLRRYPATIAVDSRITQSIDALGEAAPQSALEWSEDLSNIGLAQFGLPWADSDPLATSEIDTLVYGRLGQYPWLHDGVVTGDQLESLAARSADAILVPSTLVESDRTVVQYGSARMIRVDVELSDNLRQGVLAASEVEAEAALQRVQGLVAKRAFSQTGEVLVVDTGRLPATAIALRLEDVLSRLQSVEYVNVVGVPLEQEATELALQIREQTASTAWRGFVTEVRDLWESDVSYATIATNPEAVIFPRWNRYLALFSSAWLDNPVGRDTEWERAREESAQFQNSVQIEQGSAITVLADRTELPVTLRNTLPSEVRVLLRVQPSRAIITVEQEAIPVVIEGNSTVRLSVPVRSLANGVVPVDMVLTNAQGQPIGEAVTIPITIRAGWEGIISVVLAIAIGLVFASGIYRAIQRRRGQGTADEQAG